MDENISEDSATGEPPENALPRAPESVLFHRVMFVLRIALFAAALYSLRHQLASLRIEDVRNELRADGRRHISLSLIFTGLSFLSLGTFEILGLRYLRSAIADRIPDAKALVTGMVAAALSQSVGVALVTGSAVRVRAYSQFGLRKSDILRLSTFVTTTSVLGLLIMGAIAFLAGGNAISLGRFDVHPIPIGAALALAVILYVVWFMLNPGKEYGRGNWTFETPARAVGGMQIFLSAIDWVLTALALYFLLSPSLGLGYLAFLPAFFIAQTLATLSHVPGGVGVFESILVGLLAHSPAAAVAVLGSLVIYRVVYFIIPLVTAIAVSSAHEVTARR